MNKGIFISFESSDGSGKSTQIKLIEQYLKSLNYPVVVTREPGGTKISEKLREILLDNDNKEMSYMTEAFIYAASRAQHIDELIKPSLEQGKIVISDRFVDSSYVYQGVARELGIDTVYEINKFAIRGILPDVTFFLDLNPEIAMKRKKEQKTLDRLENEKIEFHQLTYKGFKSIATLYHNRIITIDANKTIEEIHKQIKFYVMNLLEMKGYIK